MLRKRCTLGVAVVALLALLLARGGVGAPSISADGPMPNWVQVTTSHSPSARYEHAMAYDGARGVVVLFGGQNGSDLFSDTWEYDGTDWTRVPTENRPSARYGHSMAYDASRGVTVLFGGWDGSSNLSDTWEYNGANWTKRTPSVSPRARAGHALVYDSTHSAIILFGGYYEPWLNDTWEWDGVTWTQRAPTTPGPYRSQFSLAYDSERRVVVLFGGNITGTHDDTWEYDGTAWAEKYPPTKPQPLQDYGMAYDEARELTVLFGGLSAGGQDDTWEYNGNNWVEASPATSPPARWCHRMVYDNLRSRMVIFGGINNHFVAFGDTWEYGIPPSPTPTPTPTPTPVPPVDLQPVLDAIGSVQSAVDAIESKLDPGGVVEGFINSAQEAVIGAVSSTLETVLAKLEEVKVQIVDLLTDPVFGLEEIKHEVSEIEEKLDRLDVKTVVAEKSENGNKVVFILTTLAGSWVNASISTVEVGGTILDSSQYSVTQVSTGLLKLTVNRKAIPAQGSHPLLMEMEATVDDRTVSGVDIAEIQR